MNHILDAQGTWSPLLVQVDADEVPQVVPMTTLHLETLVASQDEDVQRKIWSGLDRKFCDPERLWDRVRRLENELSREREKLGDGYRHAIEVLECYGTSKTIDPKLGEALQPAANLLKAARKAIGELREQRRNDETE